MIEQSQAIEGLRHLSKAHHREPALPRELTPLVAQGAIMEPLFVNQDWSACRLYGDCKDITLPSRDEAKASLWMEQAVMDGARDYMSYECHDLRIVKVDNEGRLELLVCKRVEPSPSADGTETAPINGFWWSIGGRREIPKSGSPLDGRFGLIHSVLHKAKREAGIEPADVMGIYDLGIGRTEFPKTMTYISVGRGETGDSISASKNVELAYPQRTINRNMILMVKNDAVVADQTVEHLTFLREEDYKDPSIRAQFCEYEQAFIDAIFAGWAMRQKAAELGTATAC